MKTFSSLAAAGTMLFGAAEASCLVGWPAIVGSSTKDDTTSVSAWSETPSSNTYILGGQSFSSDFTEKLTCANNGKGCAYLATWSKTSQNYP